MQSPDQLRTEAHRILEEAERSRDATAKQNLASRALELAQQAEAIERLPDDVEALTVRIAHYEQMLDRTDSKPKQDVIAQLVQDAEHRLEQAELDRAEHDVSEGERRVARQLTLVKSLDAEGRHADSRRARALLGVFTETLATLKRSLKIIRKAQKP